VDDVILAAARDAARQTPASRPSRAREPWWRSWQPMAAAAGVAGLAFVLVQLLPRDEPQQSLPVTPQEPAAPAAAPAPATAPAPAAPAIATVPAPEAQQERVSRDLAGNGVEADAAMATTAEAGVPPADAWVRRIVELHAVGEVAAAAAELQAFRAAYPDADAHLPEALRAWAATVPAPAPP
jgi:hypothetical protein